MSDVLSNLSNDLAELVSVASPSIVRVEARRRLPATGVVWSDEGLIVTTHHAIEQDRDIFVGLDGGDRVPAELVGRDPSTDVAVLRVNGTSLVAPTWGTVEDLKVGNLVLALGRPGDKVLATLGIISALNGSWQRRMGPPMMWGGGGGRRWGGRGRGEGGRGWGGEHRHGPGHHHEHHQEHHQRHQEHHQGRSGQFDHYVQTDVVMYPGFSGGALVGADSKVLGINSSALIRGISLTIPQATIARSVETLVKHGRVRRGFLGVGVQTVELPNAVAEEVEQDTGVLVVSVEPDSPAATAGLILGDTLITLDGDPVQSVEELLASLSGDRVGTEVTVQLLRAGQLMEVGVVIAERV